MMRAVRAILTLGLVLAIAAPLLAQQEKPKPKRPRAKTERRGGMSMMRMLRGIELTADQKAKLQKIEKEMRPKFAELRKKADAILTPEQKKARAEAMKNAREEGKRGRELFQAAREAVKLTDKQKEETAKVRKEMGELFTQVRNKLMEVLTPEQKEALKKRMQERRRGGRRQR
jgi:Spy/CpxP family protein refolding chaperone